MKKTDFSIVMAGFGGQGLLFSGKVLAYAGLLDNKNLSWLPSYGPEMRGGTANCNVIISKDPIGSPIIQKPDILMVMNNPSLDKYEDDVVQNGFVFVDSSLVLRKLNRKNLKVYYIPATQIASKMQYPNLANMVLTGALAKVTNCVRRQSLVSALHKVIPLKKANLFDANIAAIEKGEEYIKNII